MIVPIRHFKDSVRYICSVLGTRGNRPKRCLNSEQRRDESAAVCFSIVHCLGPVFGIRVAPGICQT
jgi:hypothetical protein